jgi:hypothetical protein
MARIWRQFACNQAQQAGFSGAIASAHTDSPASVKGQMHVFEQQQGAAPQREIIKTKHPPSLPAVAESPLPRHGR